MQSEQLVRFKQAETASDYVIAANQRAPLHAHLHAHLNWLGAHAALA